MKDRLKLQSFTKLGRLRAVSLVGGENFHVTQRFDRRIFRGDLVCQRFRRRCGGAGCAPAGQSRAPRSSAGTRICVDARLSTMGWPRLRLAGRLLATAATRACSLGWASLGPPGRRLGNGRRSLAVGEKTQSAWAGSFLGACPFVNFDARLTSSTHLRTIVKIVPNNTCPVCV
jgi:hypothetical protein